MTSAPLKVLLIDNHPLVLEGLKAILDTFHSMLVVGAASSALAGIAIARELQPQVVLMDINMPQISGIDAIALFREQVPGARILMLSMHDSKEYISTSVMHGASGYILKDVSTEEIVAAIETVAAGGTYFSSGVSDVLLERRPVEPVSPLTAREYSVLLLIAAGRSNRDIAGALSISTATVETHRKKIKKKLGVATTAGLTRYAMERGLI